MAYKAVIFDIGGVLVEWKPEDYLMERFMNERIENMVYRLTFGSREWAQLDAGLTTRYDVNHQMLENAAKEGCTFEVQEVIDDWVSILKPRLRVLELAAQLKANGYHIYYLSNIASDTLRILQNAGFLDEFDGGIASCDVHMIKPDTGIYNALLEKYALTPDECVFIDDNEANVKAAFDLGMTGITLHRSVNAMIRNLNHCGIKTK